MSIPAPSSPPAGQDASPVPTPSSPSLERRRPREPRAARESRDSRPPDATDAIGTPSLRALFLGFLGLGMTAFGGALPLARRMVVEKHRWVSPGEFTDLLGLCQFLPGGNIINLSVALGMRFHGWRGALASILGLIAAPSAVVIVLGMIYQRFQNDPHVKHLFAGLAAAAAGLLVQMAWKVAWPLRRSVVLGGVALACFIAIAVLRVPLVLTMLVMTPISIYATWRVSQ
ncbi:chromate transporter [Pandoraea nosoerga]|uniref:Chromate transporter n=1 Tax=Pandoraea nosoerga TaxID=2508296 RepID=A0A5E4U627_9BURK|nr:MULTISPECIES: chromate transporter [Pandoraea]MBN4667835.1 chromate transporter [Pandoraea nosoerga]MBN4677685.1 chromate transporter [Pandoraea nosoerga]MBN4682704.1 chromate transporter [Pandoraea nosoerga]MBN4746903.1 chromate transporter [Pandoraea nosoerga]VVD94932.1 chromate transporter [Pandoraea nosoerga]